MKAYDCDILFCDIVNSTRVLFETGINEYRQLLKAFIELVEEENIYFLEEIKSIRRGIKPKRREKILVSEPLCGLYPYGGDGMIGVIPETFANLHHVLEIAQRICKKWQKNKYRNNTDLAIGIHTTTQRNEHPVYIVESKQQKFLNTIQDSAILLNYTIGGALVKAKRLETASRGYAKSSILLSREMFEGLIKTSHKKKWKKIKRGKKRCTMIFDYDEFIKYRLDEISIKDITRKYKETLKNYASEKFYALVL